MNIELYGSCDRITALIVDSKNVSIALGKTGPILCLNEATTKKESLEKKADLEKLGETKVLEKLGETEDLEKLGETGNLEKLGETENLEKLGETKGLESTDQTKDLEFPDQDKGLKSPDKTKTSPSGQTKKKNGTIRSKESINSLQKKLKKKQSDSFKKDIRRDSSSKLSGAKVQIRDRENKLTKDMPFELPNKTSPTSSPPKRSSFQSLKTNTNNLESPEESKKSIPFEDYRSDKAAKIKQQESPNAIYSQALRPSPARKKIFVDRHKNCFPVIDLEKKETHKKSCIFNSPTLFLDRHTNCFPNIKLQTFLTRKFETHTKTFTDYHKTCIPNNPSQYDGRRRKFSVSDEILSPAKIKKTLLDRHKNCIPNMIFKDTYLKTEEQSSDKISKSAASLVTSVKTRTKSFDTIINKVPKDVKRIISNSKLPTGDQKIYTLLETADKDTVPTSAASLVESKKTSKESLNTIIDSNKDKDNETMIPSSDRPTGDENENTLQETSENIPQPLPT